MNTPIDNSIGAVFVPVSDMTRAIGWYNRILGLPVRSTSHDGKIYDLDMQGETRLILDGHKPVRNSSQPLFFLMTPDIKEALRFLKAQKVEIVSDIEDVGSLYHLIFRDPDGNLLMVCQIKGHDG